MAPSRLPQPWKRFTSGFGSTQNLLFFSPSSTDSDLQRGEFPKITPVSMGRRIVPINYPNNRGSGQQSFYGKDRTPKNSQKWKSRNPRKRKGISNPTTVTNPGLWFPCHLLVPPRMVFRPPTLARDPRKPAFFVEIKREAYLFSHWLPQIGLPVSMPLPAPTGLASCKVNV